MSRGAVGVIAGSIVLAGLLIGLGIFFGLRGFSDPDYYTRPITVYTRIPDTPSTVTLDGSLSVTLDGDIGVNR